MSGHFIPSQHQAPLPKLILEEAPSEESVPMDVLFVGAGPAGLAGRSNLPTLSIKTMRRVAISGRSRLVSSRRRDRWASTISQAPSSIHDRC